MARHAVFKIENMADMIIIIERSEAFSSFFICRYCFVLLLAFFFQEERVYFGTNEQFEINENKNTFKPLPEVFIFYYKILIFPS